MVPIPEQAFPISTTVVEVLSGWLIILYVWLICFILVALGVTRERVDHWCCGKKMKLKKERKPSCIVRHPVAGVVVKEYGKYGAKSHPCPLAVASREAPCGVNSEFAFPMSLHGQDTNLDKLFGAPAAISKNHPSQHSFTPLTM